MHKVVLHVHTRLLCYHVDRNDILQFLCRAHSTDEAWQAHSEHPRCHDWVSNPILLLPTHDASDCGADLDHIGSYRQSQQIAAQCDCIGIGSGNHMGLQRQA
eukprot:5822458-Pyramimonas_sp.AAC.1